MSTSGGWIGVDLDATLAHYDGWVSPVDIGAPVPSMLERVKGWRAEGRQVRIFTARIFPINACVMPGEILQFNPTTPRERDAVAALRAIQAWCVEHLREMLPVTNVKDYGMIELWDDRCVSVEPNTGNWVREGVSK